MIGIIQELCLYQNVLLSTPVFFPEIGANWLNWLKSAISHILGVFYPKVRQIIKIHLIYMISITEELYLH